MSEDKKNDEPKCTKCGGPHTDADHERWEAMMKALAEKKAAEEKAAAEASDELPKIGATWDQAGEQLEHGATIKIYGDIYLRAGEDGSIELIKSPVLDDDIIAWGKEMNDKRVVAFDIIVEEPDSYVELVESLKEDPSRSPGLNELLASYPFVSAEWTADMARELREQFEVYDMLGRDEPILKDLFNDLDTTMWDFVDYAKTKAVGCANYAYAESHGVSKAELDRNYRVPGL